MQNLLSFKNPYSFKWPNFFASYKLNINSTMRTLKHPRPKSWGCILCYKEDFLYLNSRLHQQRQAICDILIRTKWFLHQLFLLLKGWICHLVLMKRKRRLLISQNFLHQLALAIVFLQNLPTNLPKTCCKICTFMPNATLQKKNF